MKERIRHILKEETSLQKGVRNLVETKGFITAGKIIGSIEKLHKILNLKGTQEDMIFLAKAIIEHDMPILISQPDFFEDETRICNYSIVHTLHSIKVLVTIPKISTKDWVNRREESLMERFLNGAFNEYGNDLIRGHRISVVSVIGC